MPVVSTKNIFSKIHKKNFSFNEEEILVIEKALMREYFRENEEQEKEEERSFIKRKLREARESGEYSEINVEALLQEAKRIK